MKKLNLYCLILLSVLTIVSCSKEEQLKSSLVSGLVSVYDVNTPSIVSPLEGIKIYLTDGDFVPGESYFGNNSAAFLDSATTNSEGYYEFDNISAGNYVVFPEILSDNLYQFGLAENSDPYEFSVSEEHVSYAINFSTPQPVADNADDKIEIRLKVINLPVDNFVELGLYQTAWSVHLPANKNISYLKFDTWDKKYYNSDEGYIEFTSTIYATKGYTTWFGLYTLENNFYLVGLAGNAVSIEMYRITPNARQTWHDNELKLDFNNPPSVVNFTLDWKQGDMIE